MRNEGYMMKSLNANIIIYVTQAFIIFEFSNINLKQAEEYYETKNIVSHLLNRIYVACGNSTNI
jgi:hypothetical protein